MGDKQMNPILATLATQLTSLLTDKTVTTINSKISAMKNEKDIGRVKQTYDELLNNLLAERAEALRIANLYKEEIEKIEISNEDLKKLYNTVDRLIDIIKKFILIDTSKSEANEQLKAFEQIKELINVDTLKTMQLLGFNYKRAIGDPLTIILRNFILSKMPIANEKDLITPEMVNILKDKEAYENFKDWTGKAES